MRLALLLNTLSNKGVTLHCQDGQLVLEGKVDQLCEREIEALKTHKSEILRLNGTQSSHLNIEIKQRNDGYIAPVTSHQKSMRLLESLADEPYYNLPVAFKITGALNKARLQAAFSELVAHNDILRTVYSDNDHFQHIQPVAEFDLPCTKLDDEASLLSALRNEANYRFSLTKEWPVRAHIFELNDFSVLSINIHHIAADGFSAKIILDMLSKSYAQDEGAIPTESSKAQYADFSEWQHGYMASAHYEQGLNYWQQLLNHAPSNHNFPTQFQRPAMMTVQGERWKQIINTTLSGRIKQLAQQHGISGFSMMQSLFACFLSRMSECEDVVFGSVYANRSSDNVSKTVGMFANTLPFRFQFTAKDSLEEAVTQCKELTRNAKEYQYIPFEQIVDISGVDRHSNHLPLVQVMLVAQDNALEQFELESCQIESLTNDQDVSKFDFSIHLYTKGTQLEFVWEYSTELFSKGFIQKMAEYFEFFIAELIASPRDPFMIADLTREAVPNTLEKTEFEAFTALPTLIMEQALKTPNERAVKQGELTLTYAQLANKVSDAAFALMEEQYAPASRIGVYMDKSMDMIIAMLAIMRAGYVYVPLDPSYPETRIGQICDNAQLQSVVVSDVAFPMSAARHNFDMICITDLYVDTQAKKFPNIVKSDIAYILYTSGSTGTPKGVAVPHDSIFYSIQANKKVFEFSEGDTIPTVGSQAFGVSLLEILVPLLSGGTIEIVTRDEVSLLPNLIAKTQEVTVLHAVPSLMGFWLDEVQKLGNECYPNLRLLLVGGEPVSDALLKKLHAWREQVEVRVLYGMTESSVVSSSYDPKEAVSLSYCIGKPHPNVNYFVMNKYGALQPKGLIGELYVSGLSLAAEYVDNVEQTRKHFVFEGSLGQRVYKTGDLVKCHLDGHFEFLGRLDNQISLRGVRIELGDIESCINELDRVTHCVVHPQQISEEETVLVLYYTACDDHEQSQLLTEIKAHLSDRLPSSMRPTLFYHLDSLPLNANGKIDRKSLPIPSVHSEFVAPSTATEEALQVLWGELFESPMISVEGNFFELGGHSLLASKLVARANVMFEIELSIADFLMAPTIRLCGQKIDLERDKNKLQSLQSEAADQVDHEELVF